VPVKEKQLQLTEVVRVGKRAEMDQENITGQVRSEQAQIARTEASTNQDQPTAQGRPASAEAGSAQSEHSDRGPRK